MALDSQLLSLLACPEDKGPLYYFADLEVLYNPRLQRVYRIRDGIPVMLIDEAQSLEPSEGERLFARIEAENIAPTFSDAAGEAAGAAAVPNPGFTPERRDPVTFSDAAGEAAGAAAVPNPGFTPERRDPVSFSDAAGEAAGAAAVPNPGFTPERRNPVAEPTTEQES